MANLLNPPTSTDVVKGGRFGRPGNREFLPSYSDGDDQRTPRPRWAGGLARFWDKHISSIPNPFWAKPQPDPFDDGDENGVYAITKKTDYWFNRELYR